MKKLLSTLALLAATPACAQQAPAPNDADPALWMVKDEDTTVYLFGTVHVLKPGLSWFDEAVKAAFDRSDELVLEIVQPDAAAMQQIVAAKGMTVAGPTLTSRVPADKRPAFQAAVAQSGVPLAVVDRMDPWLAGVTLSLSPLSKAGYDPANGPETVLADAAKQANKPVIGLETAEQQLGYFDGLSESAQMNFLTSTVDDLPKAGEELGRMITMWSKGDPDALGRLMNENLKDTPEIAKTLLFDRNARWADWIKTRMDKPGTVFVAVGAGHLAGAGDVQDQLAARGLKAERVRY